MRSVLPLVLCFGSIACAPSVFIRRPVPPSVILPANTVSMMVERRPTGSVVLDLVELFSFADPNRNLQIAAVESVANAIRTSGGLRALVGCSPPCSEAQAVVAVDVTLEASAVTPSLAALELDIEVRDRSGAVLARRRWAGEGRAVTSGDPPDALVQRALDAAAGSFGAALQPSEISFGYNLASGNGLDAGNALLTSGDPGGAVVEYRKVIARDSSFADAHYNLAVALTAAGEDESAYEAVVEAARLSPRWYTHRVHEWGNRRPAREVK